MSAASLTQLLDGCAWCVASILIGGAFGFLFGRVFLSILYHWEGSGKLLTATSGLIVFILGGAGGPVLLAKLTSGLCGAMYLIGLALGIACHILFDRFSPVQYTKDSVRAIVDLDDCLREKVPEVDSRVALILNVLAPPQSIVRASGETKNAVRRELERAVDEYTGDAEVADSDEGKAGD